MILAVGGCGGCVNYLSLFTLALVKYRSLGFKRGFLSGPVDGRRGVSSIFGGGMCTRRTLTRACRSLPSCLPVRKHLKCKILRVLASLNS